MSISLIDIISIFITIYSIAQVGAPLQQEMTNVTAKVTEYIFILRHYSVIIKL